MVMIGVDPDKGSHTAVAIDGDERELDALRLRSSSKQCDVLLDWARLPCGRFRTATRADVAFAYQAESCSAKPS